MKLKEPSSCWSPKKRFLITAFQTAVIFPLSVILHEIGHFIPAYIFDALPEFGIAAGSPAVFLNGYPSSINHLFIILFMGGLFSGAAIFLLYLALRRRLDYNGSKFPFMFVMTYQFSYSLLEALAIGPHHPGAQSLYNPYILNTFRTPNYWLVAILSIIAILFTIYSVRHAVDALSQHFTERRITRERLFIDEWEKTRNILTNNSE